MLVWGIPFSTSMKWENGSDTFKTTHRGRYGDDWLPDVLSELQWDLLQTALHCPAPSVLGSRTHNRAVLKKPVDDYVGSNYQIYWLGIPIISYWGGIENQRAWGWRWKVHSLWLEVKSQDVGWSANGKSVIPKPPWCLSSFPIYPVYIFIYTCM